MQRIIVEVGSKDTKVDICYGEETKHILSLPIEFEEHYKKEGKISKKDIDELIKRINILNVVYYDIHIYGTEIFRKLDEEERKKFEKEIKEKTKRDFIVLGEEEKGVNYLANKEN